MDALEEDLTCSVCYSLFSDPRVLSCSHTFCKTCLDNLLQASTNYSIWRPLRMPIKCPNCRSVVELPPTGVDALPTNVSLRAVIEKYQKDSEPRPPSCQEHRRQPLNMYCIQDRQLICGLCLTVGAHQGHPIDDLQAAFIREKSTPSLLLAELSDQRWAQVCELGEQLEQEKARCEGLVRQDRQEVDQFFTSVEAVLSRKRQAHLEALDKTAAEVSQAFDPVIHRVKELQEEHLDIVSLGSSVEDEESPLVFLEKVHLFRERVDKFLKTPLPSLINLTITPRATAYLQQHWPAVTIGSLEEAPVPAVCCCTRCGNMETKAERVRAGRVTQKARCERQPTSSVLLGGLLLLLLLLLAALWFNLAGASSLGFSLLSRLGQSAHSLSTQLIVSVCEAAASTYAAMGSTVQGWSSHLCSIGDRLFQLVASSFLKR
ncbi:tripartite motif-containing protein 59 [Cololabis saira]|uniref:tripartite motif-containing protein 59 n=1 Tax=Cololabis saira TaxID=129043 RepID=UPI002AD45CFE|nr:tripartite motif-containing protein 59 [Cololabis saira]XP_061575454.1 tripartite motif-containing protein 59 [Cololabis saira]XP_061575455.1 tripartite motif-containing protein 59 [Cololabis saira]